MELFKINVIEQKEFLDKIYEEFSEDDAHRVKLLEKTTNHDVKALEYFLKEKFDENERLKELKEYIHFTCTSEDINNLAYGLMIKDAISSVILPKLQTLL